MKKTNSNKLNLDKVLDIMYKPKKEQIFCFIRK